MKQLLLTLLVFGLGLSLSAQNQFADVKTKVLANGLQVVVKEVHEAPLAQIQLSYRVGFRDSPAGLVEMPHFVEHMLFKGTPRFPRDEFSRLVSENGGYVNAFTSWERTTYVEEIPAFQVRQILEIEADRMTQVAFAAEDVEAEKKVVQSEIRGYAGNQTNAFELDVARKLGTPFAAALDLDPRTKAIDTITPESARGFYQKFYRPDNAVLVVAGDVDAKEVFAWAEAFFGKIAKPAKPLERAAVSYPVIKEDGLVQGSGIAREPYGRRYFNFLPYTPKSRDFVILFFIANTGLVPEIAWETYPEGGYLIQRFNNLAPKPLEVIDWKILESRFPAEKAKLLERNKLGFEELGTITNLLTSNTLNTGDPAYEDWLNAQYAQLQFSEIKAFVEKYFGPGPNLVAEFKISSADAQADGRSLSSLSDNFTSMRDTSFLDDPQSPRAEEYKTKAGQTYSNLSPRLKNLFQGVRDVTLDNGLRVVVRQGVLSQKTWVNLLIPAGTLREKVPFQAQRTSYLVLAGGPQIQLRRDLEKKGVSFSGNLIDNYFAGASASGPGTLLADILAMYAKTLGERKFNAKVLEAELEQNLNQFKKPTKDHNYFINETVKALFREAGGATYDPDQATAEERAKLVLQDIQNFYQTNYRPDGSILVITSPDKPEAVLELVKKSLGTWAKPAVAPDPAREPVLPGKIDKERIKTAKVDKAQENIVIFNQIVAQKDYPYDREVQLDLGSKILSDFPTGRMFRELRVKKGLTYGVSINDYSEPGRSVTLHGFLMASPQNLDAAVTGWKQIVKDFQKDGPTLAEFYFAQNKMLNLQAFRFRNTEAIHQSLVRAVFRNDPLNINLVLFDQIAASQPESLVKVWKEDVDMDKLMISITGPLKN